MTRWHSLSEKYPETQAWTEEMHQWNLEEWMDWWTVPRKLRDIFDFCENGHRILGQSVGGMQHDIDHWHHMQADGCKLYSWKMSGHLTWWLKRWETYSGERCLSVTPWVSWTSLQSPEALTAQQQLSTIQPPICEVPFKASCKWPPLSQLG